MQIEAIDTIDNRILRYKNYIHIHPESGWQEIGTTAYVKEQLHANSLIEGLGENKTGAVFVVGDGKTSIFVRADIDALKTSNGPQHLCGHSTHTAALMGAYHWLKDHESQLMAKDKKVLFIFQPAEEVHPSGARTFLDTYPDILSRSLYGFAIHVEPKLPIHTIRIQDGPVLAANDVILVSIKGRAAHVKDTPKGIDAIDGASQIVRLFRNFQKEFPTFGTDIVFNFNMIQGGVAPNCIAEEASLQGRVRWLNTEDQQRVRNFFVKLPSLLRKTFPGSIDVQYIQSVPPNCVNDRRLAEIISNYMKTHSHFEILRDGSTRLGSEDFAHFSHQYQTLLSQVGINSPYDLHESQMVVPDKATLDVYYYWKNVLQWWIEK
jgi:amidohydrolase